MLGVVPGVVLGLLLGVAVGLGAGVVPGDSEGPVGPLVLVVTSASAFATTKVPPKAISISRMASPNPRIGLL
jgi:hypothetical protein